MAPTMLDWVSNRTRPSSEREDWAVMEVGVMVTPLRASSAFVSPPFRMAKPPMEPEVAWIVPVR